MVLTDLEIAQASIETVGGFISVMLALIIIIIGHNEKSMKQIVRMLFVSAAIFVAEAMAYVFRGNTGAFSQFMTRFSNFTVFALNFVLANIVAQYVYCLLEMHGEIPGKIYLQIVRVCTLFAFLLLGINLFTGWMYYFDADNYYHRSIGWYLYTGLSLVCLAAICVLLLHYRKRFSRPTLYSLLFLEVFPIIAIVLQSLYYGISITNLGIGGSIVLVLVSYMIDWNRSEVESRTKGQVRRSYETIILFLIMVLSISASIISCIISLNRVSTDVSVSDSQVIAHIVGDHIDNVFLRPIAVTETMGRDKALRNYLHTSAKSPDSVEDELVDYLDAIRTGFDYEMVYTICESSKTYYTYNGICKTIDPENDPADAWYREFLASGKPCLLQVDTDETNNWDLSVFVNTQVLDADGSLAGVCGIGLEMRGLQEEIARFEAQYGIQIKLVDRNGFIQVDSSRTQLEPERMEGFSVDGIPKDGFRYEEGGDYRRLTRYMDTLDWYLVVDDLSPSKINVMQIVLPNIVIFMVGLFMLAVAFCVIIIRERKTNRELNEKRRTSLCDELTGLKNRRAFDEDCQKIVLDGTARETAVVMIDLNGLKTINDRDGHQAGDELIISTARCMARTLQQYGSVYRTGGDEFLALLTCTREQMLGAIADFETVTANWEGSTFHGISTAKGYVHGADHPEMALSDMIALADKRMYEDKNDYYWRTGIDRRRHI